METEYTRASSLALLSISEWCPGYTQGKIKGDELWFCSPIRDDRSPDSFSINITSGLWHDFSSEQSGNALQLFSLIRGMTEHEAVLFFAHGEETISADDPPARSGFTARWFYQNQLCAFWVYRYDLPDGKKTFSPWAKIGGEWKNKKPAAPESGFPLLSLGRIIANPEKTIVIVEGEKTADAIPREYVATTWAGGAQASDKVDLSPLKGRRVILWPDNDDPGREVMQKIKERLLSYGCILSIVNLDPAWPKGADAADFSPEEIKGRLEYATLIDPPRSIFPLTRYGDMGITCPQWIIKGVLEDKSLGLLFGSSGSGKSYLAIDMAACIATGKPFCNHAIKKEGPVIYIAGEGFSGISRRLRAWELKHGISLKDKPIFISHKACALGDPELMAHVEAEIEKIKDVSCIIIDTWARNMVGDENSTQDTGNAIRALDALRIKNNCTALIIHHSGQAEADRARGSSALRAALDVEYKVSLSADEIVTLQNTKMKDGDPPDPLMFCFDHIDLGVLDDDGAILFSAALEPVDVDEIVPKKGGRTNELDGIIIDFIQSNPDGVEKSVIINAVLDAGKKRDSGYKALNRLSKNNRIRIENGRFFNV